MNKDSYHKEDVSKEKKPLPIGISDYIRAQAEYYYVDKTLLIKEFLDQKSLVSLFTRPRRFGKTLNMDMLRVFFEKSTDYRSIMPQFSSAGIVENQKLIEWLKIIAAEKNATPAQISLAWMLAKNPFLVPIPGTRNLKRLTENIQAESIHLSVEEVTEIDDMLEHIPMSQVFGGSIVKK